MKLERLNTFYFLTMLVATLMLLSSCATNRPSSSHSSTDTYRSGQNNAAKHKGLSIAQIAQSMVGVSYRYGGSNPDEGFDCSGLVYYSHTQVGEQVPRVSYAQLAASDEVSESELKPGDLLFYRINGKPSHVGIYIGQGQFVHAPSSGKKVSISSMSNVYFKPRLIRAGRLYTED